MKTKERKKRKKKRKEAKRSEKESTLTRLAGIEKLSTFCNSLTCGKYSYIPNSSRRVKCKLSFVEQEGGTRLTDLENLKLRSYYRGWDNFSISGPDICLYTRGRRRYSSHPWVIIQISFFEIGYCHFVCQDLGWRIDGGGGSWNERREKNKEL